MIEPGYLEWQGILLIASLLEYKSDDGDIIAYCREERMSGLKVDTQEFLRASNVEVRPLSNPFSPPYPQGNKIAAAVAHGPDRNFVFLDTDVMVLKAANFSKIVKQGVFSAAAGKKAWPERDDHRSTWERAYQVCDVPFDFDAESLNERAPYFNAGVVGFAAGDNLAKEWLDVALALDNTDLPDRRPWLDQVSLPIAVKRKSLKVKPLPKIWNRGLNNQLKLSDATIIGHYHRARRLKQHRLISRTNALLQKYSKFSRLKEMIRTIHPEDNYDKY